MGSRSWGALWKWWMRSTLTLGAASWQKRNLYQHYAHLCACGRTALRAQETADTDCIMQERRHNDLLNRFSPHVTLRAAHVCLPHLPTRAASMVSLPALLMYSLGAYQRVIASQNL